MSLLISPGQIFDFNYDKMMRWNFSCFLIRPSSQRYVPWNVYWVDHLIIISNIIIAWAANTASTQSHKASVSAIARTVGHHLMDAFSWLDHPWLGRPMRHKAIFQRNVCFTPLQAPRSGVCHHVYCSLPGHVRTLENVEQWGLIFMRACMTSHRVFLKIVRSCFLNSNW